MDFDKYKSRLKEYLRQKGVDVSMRSIHCFNPAAHKNGDANPSCELFDESFKCHRCGIQGDIYDAVELIEGITDKKEQYAFIERLFGDSGIYFQPEKSADFEPDTAASRQFENYLSSNVKSEQMIRRFLDDRARISTAGKVTSYPDDIISTLIKHFYYWPGLDIALREFDRSVLKKAGIPLVNPQKGFSTWGHSGAIIKLGRGYKLHYYIKSECKKINSKSGTAFPMPGNIDKTQPAILVEGEMDAIAVSSIGVKNVFATGGTQGLTALKVKEYLLEVPEIILFFDADEPGRKASGLDPVDDSDKRKSNIPETILKAGYTGKIRIAEIPLYCGCKDQDELILAGKRDIVTQAIANAKEYNQLVHKGKKENKKHIPLASFDNLELGLLRCILRKLPRKSMEIADIQPFISACVKSFDHSETQKMLADWGADVKEIKAKNGADQRFLIVVTEKYELSRYIKRQIEKEIIFAGKAFRYIKINTVIVDIDFDELESNKNASQFIKDFNIRSAALLLADMLEDRIVYNDASNDKKFYFFNGHIWEHLPDIAGVVYDALTVVLHFFMKKEIAGIKEDEKERNAVKEFYMDRIRKIGGRRMRIEIKNELAELESFYHNADDKDDPLKFDSRENIKETITLADGVFDFSGKELVFRNSKPKEYRHKTLPYTLEQVKTGLACNKFHDFMRGNFKNKDTLEMFMFYLSLIPSMVQYKYGAFFIGGKNAGKSTTVKLIKALYGDLIGYMEKEVLVPKGKVFSAGNGPTPYLATLPGLGASIVNESDDGSTLNEALWKSLTGNDAITARGLNEAPKDFINTAQIIIQTNQMPRFNRHDDAIIERMIVIPFLEQHSRTDADRKEPDDFIEELRPEFPAIIRLLAEYYIRLKYEHRGAIKISKESESYKRDYISELDSDVDKYIEECLVFDKASVTIIGGIYEHYKNYYELDEDALRRKEGLSQHQFTRFFKKHHKDKITEKVQRIDGKPTRCFIGIRLKTGEELKQPAEAENVEKNPFD
jgi:phage/plasmid-associated DNA primase